MKIAEMTAKDLEYYINLVSKAVEGLRRLTSILERSTTVGKMQSNSTESSRETVHGRKQPVNAAHLTVLL